MKTISVFKFKICCFLLAIVSLAGLIHGTHASAQEQEHAYFVDLNSRTATRLGAPGEFPLIYDINDTGQVVGTFRTVDGFFHPFITGPNGAGMKDLGMRGGATGVNAAGQVVGQFAGHGFITGPAGVGIKDLGALSGDFSHATAINAAGQVVGQTRTDYGVSAFITGPDGAGMRDLGVLGGGFSTANDINATGQVVGESTPAGGGLPSHAFITGPDGADMRSLGTLGGTYSAASGINDAGQVVGFSLMVGDSSAHAFITGPNGADMRDLGTLGGNASFASDINDAGQVVGGSKLADGSDRAFITGPDGTGMIDLNSLVELPAGFIVTRAIAINNNNQVIAAAVPEPGFLALMLGGLVLIGAVVRRKNREAMTLST